ncbi:MAG: hypothetical protein AAGK97_07850 [Bacteroidota bacterium]
MKYISLILLLSIWSCSSIKSPTSPRSLSVPEINFRSYNPLHPQNGESVTIHYELTDTIGLEKFELNLYVYELYLNNNQLPSKKRMQGHHWGTIHQESFVNQIYKKGSFTYNGEIPNNGNFVFELIVWNTAGNSSKEYISFDVGKSPWETDKILLFGDKDGDLQSTINICFIADADFYGNWDNFKSQLNGLIFNGFFKNNMIGPYKNKWKFFYSQRELDGKELYLDYRNLDKYPDYLLNGTIEGIDAFGLIHQTEYSDASYLKSNLSFLAFNMFTSESYNYGTAVHECGHAVFNLYDEYNGCACTKSQGGANVFQSQEACQEFLISNNIEPYTCPEIRNYKGEKYYVGEENNFFNSMDECQAFNTMKNYPNECIQYRKADGTLLFRSEPAVCIMQDDGDDKVNAFQNVCSKIIENYYMAIPEYKAENVAEQITNLYHYEPVLISEFVQDVDQETFELKSIDYGIPSKMYCKADYMVFDCKNEMGNSIHHFSIANPKDILIHHDDVIETNVFPNIKKVIKLPINEDLFQVACNKLNKDNSREQQEDIVLEVGDTYKTLMAQFKDKK